LWVEPAVAYVFVGEKEGNAASMGPGAMAFDWLIFAEDEDGFFWLGVPLLCNPGAY